MVTCSPSCSISVTACPQLLVPTIHGICISRETIAAWQVIPPLSVMIAAAFFIVGTQSGEVINVTNISPSSNSSISLGSAITCTFPVETPGLAGNPLTKIFLVLSLRQWTPLLLAYYFYSTKPFLDELVLAITDLCGRLAQIPCPCNNHSAFQFPLRILLIHEFGFQLALAGLPGLLAPVLHVLRHQGFDTIQLLSELPNVLLLEGYFY